MFRKIEITFFRFEYRIQSSNINFEIHYMNNIHKYAYYLYIYKYKFSTYIKIHPYVIVEYLQDATNLVTIVINGTYQPINE